ncbi:ovalbumin-related protein X [Hylaeus volcanicus]|uniref:ovalbumin-related protein X n=1 Tax=Hylaeus volcanicus TaxID=313075 RepID=UPI0023B83C84|nr:ovalbumin-related protein X [Hylaeus volcanicus]
MHLPKGNLLVACLISIAMAANADTDQALYAVSQGTSQFSSSLFQAAVKENSDNLVVSPVSIGIVLAMATYGARGETERQLKEALHIPTDSVGLSGYQALIDTLNGTMENELDFPNKVFINEKFSIKPSYQELMTNYFRSTAQSVNFNDPNEAANAINTWIQENTKDRIKNVVGPSDFDGETPLVLVNAAYFKGQWKQKFNPWMTERLTFHVNETAEKDVPTMHMKGTFNYGSIPHLNAKFIELPYKGDNFSMVIILPNEISGLAEVEKELQNTSVISILNQGSKQKVQLYLPKFKIESSIKLNNVLKNMGLTDMFAKHANFSGISDEKLYVDKVLHKASMEVNEEGSEAAAATVVEFAAGSALVFNEEPVPYMRIDHPFIYSCIYKTENKEADVIQLFTGHVIDPES